MNKYHTYIYIHTTKRCKRDTKKVKGESYDVSREDSINKNHNYFELWQNNYKIKMKKK